MNFIKKTFVGVLLFFLGITSVYALDVSIKSINIKEKSDTIEVSNPTISNNNIISTIKFHELNDSITFEVGLDNDSDHTITGVTDNNESEYIESSYTYEDTKFYLTLKYNKELSGDLDLKDIEITVTFSDGTNGKINPKTSDNIIKYVVLLAISSTLLLLIFKSYRKQVIVSLLLIAIALPVITYATDSLTSTYILKVDNISVIQKLTITYEKNGGTGNTPNKEITKGEKIGTLPEVTRENYVLEGWYSDSDFENKVDSNYMPDKDVTLYAKWLKSVNGSTIDPEELSLVPRETKTITVSNVEEDYTFTSSDTDIVTVDSDGNVVGVAIGTATITIKGNKSGETKEVQVEVVSAITYINRQVEEQITPGDEIAIGDEHFYVVSSDSTNTRVLAKYNLYVGDIMNHNSTNNDIEIDSTISKEDEKYGLQHELAKGAVIGDSKFYGTVAFSGTNYWTSDEFDNIYKSNLNTEEPEYDYSAISDHYRGGIAQNNGYTIAYYVEEYVNRLKEMGAPETITGRLLLNSEAEIFGCELEWSCSNEDFSWIYSTSYWMGSAATSSYVEWISTSKAYDYDKYPNNASYGVRPVIILNTSDLEGESGTIVSFNVNGGTVTPTYKLLENGEAVGELPIPVRNNYVFEGWYTESTFDNKVDETYVPSGNKGLYAKMLKSIKGSTVTPTEINIEVGETETITVTNVEEEYTFSSSDDDIATVDANGLVTAVDSGNVTITITGSRSHETKTVSVTVASAPANPISYINRQTPGTISIGDEIAIGDEHFYVVSTNSSTTAMLAKYNLYVGDIMDFDQSNNDIKWSSTIEKTDEKYGLQNSLAVGQKNGESKFYGTVAFSGTRYWTTNYANVYDSSLNGTPPAYDYEPVYGHYRGGVAQENNYTIAYYVEEYVDKLKEMGAPETITGRLLTNADAEDLGCYSEDVCTNSNYSWAYSTSYWTASVDPGISVNNLGFISSANLYDFVKYNANASYGVRPVIVINTIDLDV